MPNKYQELKATRERLVKERDELRAEADEILAKEDFDEEKDAPKVERLTAQIKRAGSRLEMVEEQISEALKAPAVRDDSAALEEMDSPGTLPAQPKKPKASAELQRTAFSAYLRHGYNGMGDKMRAALTTAEDDLGGVLMPEDFHAELLKDLPGFSVVRGLGARQIPTRGDFAVFPALASGTDPYASDVNSQGNNFKTESGLLSSVVGRTDQDKPTFERARIPVHYWSPAHIILGVSLLNNPVVDLVSEISRLLAETKGLDEDWSFLVGDGVNKPKGIVQDAIDSQITTVNSGAAANLAYGGLVDLFVALPAQYRQNAAWVMNSVTYGEILKLEDAAGNPLINANTTPMQLFNRPIAFSEFMADCTTGGNEPIIFGDFRYYGIADGVEFRATRLEELYAPSLGLLVYARVGGQALRTSAFRVMTVAS